MAKKPSKPHDEFFKAAFSRLEVVQHYLQKLLPLSLLQALDLEELEPVSGSYVSPTLREFFSDLVYQCALKDSPLKVMISILFEHKSSPERYPHFQLLRYLLDAWEEQLKQKKPLTLFIPVIIYHGEENWAKRDLSAYFEGDIPESLWSYLPRFDYHLTHVTAMSDQQILDLGKGLLINTFLMMKHIWDPEFILQNPQLIFVDLDEPNNPRDFIVSLLAYFLKNSELAREKIKGFIEILPRTLNQTAMSTYEMILEEGIEQGRIKEREIGQELLTKERLRAEGEHLRAEEERLRAEGEHLRAEEERLRLDNVIIYLHEISHLPLPEIALMTDHTIAYIEVLIAKRNEEV